MINAILIVLLIGGIGFVILLFRWGNSNITRQRQEEKDEQVTREMRRRQRGVPARPGGLSEASSMFTDGVYNMPTDLTGDLSGVPDKQLEDAHKTLCSNSYGNLLVSKSAVARDDAELIAKTAIRIQDELAHRRGKR